MDQELLDSVEKTKETIVFFMKDGDSCCRRIHGYETDLINTVISCMMQDENVARVIVNATLQYEMITESNKTQN